MFVEERKGTPAFREPVGRVGPEVDDEPISVLHQHTAHVAEGAAWL